MARSNKVLIAAGAIGMAAATGFLMQGGAGGVPLGLLATGPAVDVDTLQRADSVASSDKTLELSGIALTAAEGDHQPEDMPTATRDTDRALRAPTSAPRLAAVQSEVPEPLPQAATLDEDCPVTMQAEPTAAALVNLAFSAECDPYTRVTFAHAGVSFSEITDSRGRIEITVPALTRTAQFTARLSTGDAAVATVEVSSVDFYDRAVLQSRGRTGMTLHALEFGAGYDGNGHVSQASPRDPSVAARGEGGFLMVLGDPSLAEAQRAEIYTFPSGTAKTSGDVRLSVEAEVLADTCDREVRGHVLQFSGAKTTRDEDVMIRVPGCDAVGDFLLLKTSFDDLKIAGR